ncbi:hypothetical protein M2101_000311 [Parabacteroides sp. PM5-20]|uniref:hypothetical protein n=1 Tax=unclassified Parabacteroides TaxID=2649774 RepID=UPI0013D02A35|nr:MULTISPECIES: hypothetical protein [unclassified Parabacteroides]MDH6533670.1 hypothetical protein [Parabacteroides sp. PM5-20]
MNRYLLFLFLFVMGYVVESAAQSGKGQFLLEEFQDGTVYYRDGRRFVVPLNYNVLLKRFFFLDKGDNNQMKEFAEKELVTFITIGSRRFLYDKKEIKEVLQLDPPVLVEYRGVTKDKGKKAGYGGTSSTAAIDNYSGFFADGTYHALEDEAVAIDVSRILKKYMVLSKGKQKFFVNASDFLKIYPQHKEVLKEYIKANKIQFSVTEDVVNLYNYALSLN